MLADDFSLLAGNAVQSAGDLLRPFLRESSSLAAGGTYRPLTELSIGLDYLIWGAAPFGYHLSNLLWHVLCTVACYWLARALVPLRPVVALSCGLLFALHPVHGDAIFWISGRSDLLCTFFYLTSLVLFVHGRGPEQRRVPTAASLGCFILALFAKELALSLPLTIVLIDLAAPSSQPFRRRFRSHIWRYLLYGAVALAYLGLRLTVLPSIGRAQLPGPSEALFNFLLYIKLLLVPVETQAGLRGGVIICLSVLTVAVAFLRYARMGDRRNLLLATLWTLLVLAPMLDAARRWQLYLPSVGVCLFLGVVLAGLAWRRDPEHPRWLSRVSAAGLALLFVTCTVVLSAHARVYQQAGALAARLVAGTQRLAAAALPAGEPLVAANLPAVLRSWTGDQPVFASGFGDALTLARGIAVQSAVLSTLYLQRGEEPRPAVTRLADGALRLTAGGGAYGFSFHSPAFITGRDSAEAGRVIDLPEWTVTVEEMHGSAISRIRLSPRRPLGAVLYWDGEAMRLLR